MKVIRIAVTLLAFVELAHAQAPKPDQVSPALLEKIRQASAKKLRDPYSAHFDHMKRGIRTNVKGKPTEVVCGLVNAKNAYGAYVGLQPFIYFVADGDFQIQRAGDAADAVVMPAMLKTFCTGLL